MRRPAPTHFAAVRAHLDALGVPYRVEPTLVRGLDYYTRTAFEYYRRGAEGQQQALGGGGRYDGLVELLGGRPTPGIGFALGLDRVLLALEESGGAAAAPRRRRWRSSWERIRPTPSRGCAWPGCCAPRGCACGRSWRRGSWAGSSRRRRATTPTSRSSSATSWPDGDVQLKDLEAGTQRLVPLAELARELARAAKSHHHG